MPKVICGEAKRFDFTSYLHGCMSKVMDHSARFARDGNAVAARTFQAAAGHWERRSMSVFLLRKARARAVSARASAAHARAGRAAVGGYGSPMDDLRGSDE